MSLDNSVGARCKCSFRQIIYPGLFIWYAGSVVVVGVYLQEMLIGITLSLWSDPLREDAVELLLSGLVKTSKAQLHHKTGCMQITASDFRISIQVLVEGNSRLVRKQVDGWKHQWLCMQLNYVINLWSSLHTTDKQSQNMKATIIFPQANKQRSICLDTGSYHNIIYSLTRGIR